MTRERVCWTGLTNTMTAAGPTKAYSRPPSKDNQQLQEEKNGEEFSAQSHRAKGVVKYHLITFQVSHSTRCEVLIHTKYTTD